MPRKLATSKLTDRLRAAIEASGVSRYRIAREVHIAESTLCRFMTGDRGFSLDALDRLADFLQLDLVPRPKAKARKPYRKG